MYFEQQQQYQMLTCTWTGEKITSQMESRKDKKIKVLLQLQVVFL